MAHLDFDMSDFAEVVSTRAQCAHLQRNGIVTLPLRMVGDRNYRLLYSAKQRILLLKPDQAGSAVRRSGSLAYVNARQLLQAVGRALPEKAMTLETATDDDGSIAIQL